MISEIQTNNSFIKIFISIGAISLIRTFLENFSNPDQSGNLFPFHYLFLHYPIYYYSLFLSLTLLVYFFTRTPLIKIANFGVAVFLFVLIPPIIDLIATGGTGAHIAYITTEPQNFGSYFLKLINPFGFKGVTMGVHIAAYLILLSFAFFVYKTTKSLLKSILFVLTGYTILFLYALSPSLLALPNYIDSHLGSAQVAYINTLDHSWSKQAAQNLIGTPTFIQNLNYQLQDTYWITPLTQLLYILVLLQLLFFLKIANSDLFKILKTDIQTERVVTWLTIATLGIFIDHKLGWQLNLNNIINIFTLITFYSVITLNIWLAVCINDSEDIAIDKITNPTRPLASDSISLEQWQTVKNTLACLIIIGLATLNYTCAFLLLLAQAAYYLYSSSPLRLKRHFISSTILTGLAALFITMSGFFLVSTNQQIKTFPVALIFIITISFGLIFNVKDIKDYEGDKLYKIKTLPVVIGLKKSKKLLAFFSFVIFILVPFVFNNHYLLPLSIVTGFFMIYLLTKKNYTDRHVFLLIFIYVLAIILI